MFISPFFVTCSLLVFFMTFQISIAITAITIFRFPKYYKPTAISHDIMWDTSDRITRATSTENSFC